MRFSAITALCAAPLALAGTLQADMIARGAVGVEARAQIARSDAPSEKGSSKSSNNNDGNVVIQESTSITEIIIIWVNNGGNAATSTVNSAVSIASATAAAATHSVVVGGSAGLVYTPNSISANMGDTVIFTFLSNNHTATQSAFTTPCERLAGGKDSGFMANINNTVSPPPQMAMQVTVSTPIWFYCRQSGHCGKGMTFSINPTANKTQAMFEQMAISQNGTGTAGAITGGTATSAAAAPPASSTAAAPPPASSSTVAASSGTVVSGTGILSSSGSCSCSCLCGVAAFPNVALQGIGGFGGMSGAMPLSALES